MEVVGVAYPVHTVAGGLERLLVRGQELVNHWVEDHLGAGIPETNGVAVNKVPRKTDVYRPLLVFVFDFTDARCAAVTDLKPLVGGVFVPDQIFTAWSQNMVLLPKPVGLIAGSLNEYYGPLEAFFHFHVAGEQVEVRQSIRIPLRRKALASGVTDDLWIEFHEQSSIIEIQGAVNLSITETHPCKR